MKFIKLSLLILPLTVIADIPIMPVETDAVESTETVIEKQVEQRSLSVGSLETSGSYTSDEDGLEEVVVTGIRRSLEDAISIKRNNVGIVDAITCRGFW
jgi:hypothetical protein